MDDDLADLIVAAAPVKVLATKTRARGKSFVTGAPKVVSNGSVSSKAAALNAARPADSEALTVAEGNPVAGDRAEEVREALHRDKAAGTLESLARARAEWQSIVVDNIHEILAEWDLDELMAGLNRSDELAMQQFFRRKRIVQVIQAGMRSDRIAVTRYGPDRQPDHAARALWLKVLQKFHIGPKQEKGAAAAVVDAPQSMDEMLATLDGKPALLDKVIDRLKEMRVRC